jgi:hypothetical protein
MFQCPPEIDCLLPADQPVQSLRGGPVGNMHMIPSPDHPGFPNLGRWCSKEDIFQFQIEVVEEGVCR